MEIISADPELSRAFPRFLLSRIFISAIVDFHAERISFRCQMDGKSLVRLNPFFFFLSSVMNGASNVSAVSLSSSVLMVAFE